MRREVNSRAFKLERRRRPCSERITSSKIEPIKRQITHSPPQGSVGGRQAEECV